MSKDCVWSPHHQELIKKIEKVQMRATKLLSRTRNLKHKEHLKILNLPTLKYRTVRGDMTELYNIITCKQDELRRYRPQIISATHTTFVIIQLQSQATVKKILLRIKVYNGIPSATPDPCEAAAHWPPWFTNSTKT